MGKTFIVVDVVARGHGFFFVDWFLSLLLLCLFEIVGKFG